MQAVPAMAALLHTRAQCPRARLFRPHGSCTGAQHSPKTPTPALCTWGSLHKGGLLPWHPEAACRDGLAPHMGSSFCCQDPSQAQPGCTGSRSPFLWEPFLLEWHSQGPGLKDMGAKAQGGSWSNPRSLTDHTLILTSLLLNLWSNRHIWGAVASAYSRQQLWKSSPFRQRIEEMPFCNRHPMRESALTQS